MFSQSEPGSVFCIGFSKNPRNDFGVYAKGYFLAGSVLAEQVLGKGRFGDYEAYPIVYLYRQSLELLEKHILYQSARLSMYRDMTALDDRLYKSHDIHSLAGQVRGVLRKMFPGDQELDKVARELISVTKELCKWDPNSEAFRYPIKNDGTPWVTGQQVFNLRSLSSVIGDLYEKLHVIDFGLNVEIDRAKEVCSYLVDQFAVEREASQGCG